MENTKKDIDIKQLYLLLRGSLGSIKKRCVDEEIKQVADMKQLAVDISISDDAGFRYKNLIKLEEKLDEFYAQETEKLAKIKSQFLNINTGDERILTKFEYSRLLRLTYTLPRIKKIIKQILGKEDNVEVNVLRID